ncbi:hypothetical protein CASFOL_033990 [Castilleja foliolosa]|uniref:Uncharacterized protein n=1 Tax=Castilleja foliolosa TaxID=1961234 RepID=A0ABD3BZD1_9LAMI
MGWFLTMVIYVCGKDRKFVQVIFGDWIKRQGSVLLFTVTIGFESILVLYMDNVLCTSPDQNKGEEANYGCERAQLNHEKSQEVSSESHNKALSFVDHFLSVSDLGFCKNLKSEMTKKMASPPSLRSKGSQCLARKVSLAHDTGEQMPYDWTENHTEEDKNSDFGFKGEKFEHLPSVQESYNENLQENKYSANVLDVSSLKTNESEKIGSNSRNFTSCEDL